MIAFINEHRDIYGVEPICKVLPIAPSTYRLHAARQRDPSLLPDRARRDLVLMEEIERVFETNYSVYGARKVWRQLRREGRDAARCTVERLMRDLGLAGAIRGKPVKTTVSDKGAACPLDRVNRQFQAPEPNRLWVADFTYVATWAGFVVSLRRGPPSRISVIGRGYAIGSGHHGGVHQGPSGHDRRCRKHWRIWGPGGQARLLLVVAGAMPRSVGL